MDARMRFPRLWLLLALLCAGEALAIDFTIPRTIRQRQVRDWAALGEHTLVRTDSELVLVDWSRPDGERDRVLVADFPQASYPFSGLHRCQGALVALAPGGRGGHAVVTLDQDGEPRVEIVDDPDWLPPQVWLGGKPWFVRIAYEEIHLIPALGIDGGYVRVYPTGGFWPHFRALDGDRVVVAHGGGPDGEPGLFQVGDISDPHAPVWGPVVTADAPITAIEVVGDALCLGAGEFQVWDISDVDAPAMAWTSGRFGDFTGMTRGPGDVVACWFGYGEYDSSLLLYDVSDPRQPRVQIDQNFLPFHSYARMPLVVSSEQVVLREGWGLRRFWSTASSPACRRGEAAWPVVDDETRKVATDGRFVWVQREGRLLADMTAGTVVSVPTPHVPPNDWGDAYPSFFRYHRGHLINAPGNGYLQIEDVSDPARAVTVAEILSPVDEILDVDLAGDRLALAYRTHVDVYDVSEPAAPALVGSMTLRRGVETIDLLENSLAVLADETYGPDSLRVMGFADGGGLTEHVRLEIGDYDLMRTNSIGHDLYVEVRLPYSNAWYWRWYATAPPFAARLVDSGQGTVPMRPVVELDGEKFYVDGGASPAVDLYGYHGPFDPEQLVKASTTLPYDPLHTIVSGPWIVVLQNGRVCLTGVSLAPASVGTRTPGTPRVTAVPNPCNPRTEIVFAMGQAGPAEIEILDLRGHRVRVERGVWPEGSQRVVWEGIDDEGRAVGAGVYLLRVTTPTGTAHGRVTLVR